MQSGCIEFRVGVDDVGAKPPTGFPHRFAVLTWIDCDGDGAMPWSLLRGCIPAVAREINADAVLTEFWAREKKLFQKSVITKVSECTWEELMKNSDEILQEHQDFPDRFRFERSGQVVLLAESERWDLVGGPMPYHDSVTLSFFSAKDLSSELKKIFSETAVR